MAMKTCPVCGEHYSDTYQNCPFCEEEEALRDGDSRRHFKRRTMNDLQHKLVTPALVVLILFMTALLVYLLYGNQISQRFSPQPDNTETTQAINEALEGMTDNQTKEMTAMAGGNTPSDATIDNTQSNTAQDNSTTTGSNKNTNTAYGPPTPSIDQIIEKMDNYTTTGDTATNRADNDITDNMRTNWDENASTEAEIYGPLLSADDTTQNDNPVVEDYTISNGNQTTISYDEKVYGPPANQVEDQNAIEYAAANALPNGLSLNIPAKDFTVRKIGEVTSLRAKGGNGNYRWISQDPSIASVDQNGQVTAVSYGKTNILATDGNKKVVCIVRVKKPLKTSTSSKTNNTTTTTPKINKTDFTRYISEGTYTLKVTGVDAPITWTSSNPAAATVSDTGVVTPVARGKTTVTASWGSGSNQSLKCIVRIR